MIDHDVAAALSAILAVAQFAAVELTEILSPFLIFTVSGFHNVKMLTGAVQ
jgi:hypothetical protein